MTNLAGIGIGERQGRIGNDGTAWVDDCAQHSSRDFGVQKLAAENQRDAKAKQTLVGCEVHKTPPDGRLRKESN
jgi:hypothetical protein